MGYELIVNSTQNGSRVGLLENKNLVEYQFEKEDHQFRVGDIYLGKVRKVVPGLNAAFIELGYEKDAFLHYLDLGPNFRTLQKFTKRALKSKQTPSISRVRLEPEINKLGKINQVLSKNDQILVQIAKEPISTKGPRLSCELSLAGRYLVLVPFGNGISISKKIASSDERKRLSRLVTSIKPANFGVIIRTVAEGKEVAELDKDLRNLVEGWKKGIATLKTATPPQVIIGEVGKTSSILRDLLNKEFDSIVVDDKNVFNEVKGFIKVIAPEKEKIVKLYNGKAKIFENYGIEKQLKSLFGQSVSLRGGGYIIIEHTEALHVIDVNSGNKSTRIEDQETTALSTNLEAVKEVARQLRLRDMGGIIVIDFIDMKKTENKKLIYKRMKEEMEDDRSKSTILPLTKFGLMQITRQRVRPEMNITTRETCPTCGGTGKISASILVADEIERNIDHLLTKQNEKNITVILHPYLFAYFKKGVFSKQWGWFAKYNRWVKLVEDSSLPLTEYKIVNKEDHEIELTEG